MKLKEYKFNQLELMLRQTEFVTLSQLQVGLANWEAARKPKQQLSARQVFRYIKELEILRGIQVETRRVSDEFKEPAYRIYNTSLIDAFGLTDEQIEQLMLIIEEGNVDDGLRAKLLQLISSSRAASNYFRDNAIIIEKAIKSRVRIVIREYFSRKKTEPNLKLEPVKYDSANGRLYALRVDKINDKVRKYNLELMKDIHLTDESYKPIFGFDPNKVEHDVFGFMPGKIVYNVSLLLKPYAYSLLFRQFPHLLILIEKLTTPIEDFYYRLQVKVYTIQPIARFVTGLLDQIKIEGDEKTITAIKKYIDDRVLGSMAQNFGDTVDKTDQ
jgi:hypothetical protein